MATPGQAHGGVGGFWADYSEVSSPLEVDGWPIHPHDIPLATGRGAIYLLIQQWRPPRLWLPSYCCEAMIRPATALGVPVSFLPVDQDLRLDMHLLEVNSTPGDMVVAIEYFGFPTPVDLADACQDLGLSLVIDASQSVIPRARPKAAAVLFGPRKTLPVADGAVLRVSPSHKQIRATPPPADEGWLALGRAAAALRSSAPRNRRQDWFDLSQEFERRAPLFPARMSEISRARLSAVDLGALQSSYSRNYEALHERLCDVSLSGPPESGVVPTGFAMRIAQQRDSLISWLVTNEVFPPVHWPRPPDLPRVPGDSRLHEEELTLPIDARYDTDDMQAVAALVRAWLDDPDVGVAA